MYYASEFMRIPSGNASIRCMILLWMGDYPAQESLCVVGSIHAADVHYS